MIINQSVSTTSSAESDVYLPLKIAFEVVHWSPDKMALLDYRFVDLQLCNRSLWTFGLLMFFGGCQPQIHFRSLHQLGLKLLYILHGLILYFFEFLLSRVDCWLIWVPSGINLYVWSLCSSFLA